jgi:hypothetical protein
MPRKIRIINESVEKDEAVETEEVVESIELPAQNEPKEIKVKEKKPRTEKQILAFQKAQETRKLKLEEKKALEEKVEISIVEEKIEIPKVKKPRVKKVLEEKVEISVEEKVEIPKRAKGRPTLTEEQIEYKKSLKEQKLEEQLTKMKAKLDQQAKKQAKKKILDKIKQELIDDGEISNSDDDAEIKEILKKQKKPIVIINKMEQPSTQRKVIRPPSPNVVFC